MTMVVSVWLFRAICIAVVISLLITVYFFGMFVASEKDKNAWITEATNKDEMIKYYKDEKERFDNILSKGEENDAITDITDYRSADYNNSWLGILEQCKSKEKSTSED